MKQDNDFPTKPSNDFPMKPNEKYTSILPKKAIILDLDDVLYPKRDYLLQVYYLFANFIEFSLLNPPAGELLAYLKEQYEANGESGLFDRAATQFPEIETYRENFDRLHHQAQLPLKLLLFPEIAALIHHFRTCQKEIFLLTAGDPLMQLNKIRQIDWQGLEENVKVYFEDELKFRGQEPLSFILEEHGLRADEVAYIGHSEKFKS